MRRTTYARNKLGYGSKFIAPHWNPKYSGNISSIPTIKTIKFDKDFKFNDHSTTKFVIQRFTKNNVNPKTRYRVWSEALKKSTKMGVLGYQGARSLVKVMQDQEGWKLDATFYFKTGFHTRWYKIRRAWNLKKGRERRVVMWESEVKEWDASHKLYLGSFHATVL